MAILLGIIADSGIKDDDVCTEATQLLRVSQGTALAVVKTKTLIYTPETAELLGLSRGIARSIVKTNALICTEWTSSCFGSLRGSAVGSKKTCDDICSAALLKPCVLRRNALWKVSTNVMVRAERDLRNCRNKKKMEGETATGMR